MILAYTDASAMVHVSCKCNKSKWSLNSVDVDIMTTIHYQKGGYGSNFAASFFAQKSELEHVNDIKSAVRHLISNTVAIREMILKLNSYENRNACVSANKKVIGDLVSELINEVVQESVNRRDNSGSHTYGGL